ncbi:MAG: hypothetical protein AAF804_10700, partial [Bacteroidota bacterium]
MRFFSLICLIGCWFSIPAQPAHDACRQAKALPIGQWLNDEDNSAATINPELLPPKAPETCIKTFENDLWYEFTTEAPYQYYSITIDPLSCETPAGLQMILIKADSCALDSFNYTACVNPYAVEPLEFFWENPFVGEHYFLYVDGFDGNRCQYRIFLQGYESDPRTEQDIRRLRYDNDHPEPSYLDADLRARFENNEVVLNWESESREEVAFFLVERIWQNSYDSTIDGAVEAIVEPSNTVGTDLRTQYQQRIVRNFAEGAQLCYQVVKIYPDLSRAYSEISCVETELVDDFFISEVYPYEQ